MGNIFYDTFLADYNARKTASYLAEEIAAHQNTNVEIEYMQSLENLSKSLTELMAIAKEQNRMVSYRKAESELSEVTEKMTNLKIQLGLIR